MYEETGWMGADGMDLMMGVLREYSGAEAGATKRGRSY